MVVGYQTLSIAQGFSMATPTFKVIQGGGYKLGDISVAGAQGYGDFYGQMINADGSWGATYYYLTEDMTGAPDGWYADSWGETSADAVEVPYGSGLFITSTDGTVELTVSGLVPAGKQTITIPVGFSQVGNSLPVGISLSSIEVSGAQGYGDFYCQAINSDGSWGDTYYYLTEDMTGAPNGWYVDSWGETAADVTVQSGEAFFFTSTDGDCTITLPAVLYFFLLRRVCSGKQGNNK